MRLEPYRVGAVLPHERTLEPAKLARLELLRAVRTKLSPVLLLHEGPPPELPNREPDLTAEFEGVRTRLWRVGDSGRAAPELGVKVQDAGRQRPAQS